MTASIGSGGQSDPVSADGLICPEAFPCSASDLNTQSIKSGAESIRKMKDTVVSRTDSIHSVWSGLPDCYEAPEQERVYKLMDKPKKAASDLGDRMKKVAQYIDDYADALDGIKNELRSFEKTASNFEKEARKGYEEVDSVKLADMGHAVPLEMPMKHVSWREHAPAVKKNEDLLKKYAGFIERISSAAADAANGINSQLQGACAAPVEPITADSIMNSPDSMPWGSPVDEDRECHESVGHGAVNFGKNTVDGIRALFGRDPETGEKSWENAGQTWLGVGDFLVSTALFAGMNGVPALAFTKFGPEGPVKNFMKERHSTYRGGWGGLIGWDEATHRAGGDGWGKFKEDPVAATTEGVLNVGTFFIPGGQAGGAVKAASTAGRAASMASAAGKIANSTLRFAGNAADFAVPGASWLANKTANAFHFGHPHPSALNPSGIINESAPQSRGGAEVPDSPGSHSGQTVPDLAVPPRMPNEAPASAAQTVEGGQGGYAAQQDTNGPQAREADSRAGGTAQPQGPDTPTPRGVDTTGQSRPGNPGLDPNITPMRKSDAIAAGAPNWTPEDVEAVRANQVPPGGDHPIDPRTGAPLNEVTKTRPNGETRVVRHWEMQWDPDSQQWVGRNKGAGWGAGNEPLEDPVPLDVAKAKEYASGDVTLPGDHPPRTPPETFDRATKTDGYEYKNRSVEEKDWMKYQEQITGHTSPGDGRLVEYTVNMDDGSTVSFDGRTERNGQEVFLEAKDGYEVLYNDPRGTVAESMAENLEKQAKRQVDALPDGATLEWHCSTQKGATALRNLLGKDYPEIKIVYTPRRGV